jgi:hypothetical protein
MIRTLTLVALLVPSVAAGAAKPTASTPMWFVVTTPKLTQELKVVRKTKKAVSFELNLSGSCQRKLAATAKLKGGDLEMDEDEKGLSYPAEEFVYENKTCAVYLRLKHKDAQRAIVMQAGDCATTCNPVEDLMFRTDVTTAAAAKTKPAK